MKCNLGCGHRDILFREHENTGVSNIMPFLFFYCGCVGELSNIRFRSTTSSERGKYKSSLYKLDAK